MAPDASMSCAWTTPFIVDATTEAPVVSRATEVKDVLLPASAVPTSKGPQGWNAAATAVGGVGVGAATGEPEPDAVGAAPGAGAGAEGPTATGEPLADGLGAAGPPADAGAGAATVVSPPPPPPQALSHRHVNATSASRVRAALLIVGFIEACSTGEPFAAGRSSGMQPRRSACRSEVRRRTKLLLRLDARTKRSSAPLRVHQAIEGIRPKVAILVRIGDIRLLRRTNAALVREGSVRKTEPLSARLPHNEEQAGCGGRDAV